MSFRNLNEDKRICVIFCYTVFDEKMKKKYTFGQIPKTDNRLKDINGKCAMKRLFGPRIFSD